MSAVFRSAFFFPRTESFSLGPLNHAPLEGQNPEAVSGIRILNNCGAVLLSRNMVQFRREIAAERVKILRKDSAQGLPASSGESMPFSFQLPSQAGIIIFS